MFLIFDTETTGLPKDFKAPITDTDNWPRVIQIAWQLHDVKGNILEHKDFIIKPEGFNIPIESESIHGISTELAIKEGFLLKEVLDSFLDVLSRAEFIVGQNLEFDINVLGSEFIRTNQESPISSFPVLDTCTEKTALLCKLPGGRGGKFKKPTLTELHFKLFGSPFSEAHNATADVEATTRCFLELIRTGHFGIEELNIDTKQMEDFVLENPKTISPIGLKHQNLKAKSEKLRSKELKKNVAEIPSQKDFDIDIKSLEFAHLHVFSQFSVLQSTVHIKKLVDKVGELKMPAIALTDLGNMMAAFRFERVVSNYNKEVRKNNELEDTEKKEEILPIIGCTYNICSDRLNKSVKDNGYQVVLLAKNKSGYQNLIKLASIAYTEGFYYVPRIDKDAIQQYHKDIIVLSGNMNGEIPGLILKVGETQAEESLVWWKNLFGDDFYIEINRHQLEFEQRVNDSLISLARKHNVKLIGANSVYYLNQEDSESHDVLLCVKENELVSTPKGRGRGFRYGLENDSYYLKSKEEMQELFSDLPEAIANISEVIAKCEHYPLQRDVLLPEFSIPDQFLDPKDKKDGGKRGENNYLKHLTFEGAKSRYKEITPEITKRIEFELKTIQNTGYPGYFLIVQDFCKAARDMGVSVGPGRGSAAGSVVAYCNGITNVDPIEYNLLFERFLNPDRISMPDIDIDFDDEGRSKVIDYVIDKYGAKQVAQIITYGTMAAKSAIRDASRVMDLPLHEADRLSKLVPPISLNKLFGFSEKQLSEKLQNRSDFNNAKELRQIFNNNNGGLASKVLKRAFDIEGSVRNVGTHACGVIITPDEISNYVPIALAKDSDMYCTQYDNSVAEDAGLLKMDFLGLKTLSLIKGAVKYIKQTRAIELEPDDFPLDDQKTFKLFQKGETVGVFQYESLGMQKHLRDLKPTAFADLIAMNALYRPGPMEYIPSFVKRKHGDEQIIYDLPDCEEYLKETYGITVYQEQVMLLSQKLAGFTGGEADTLRKAMGKKDKATLDKMKPIYLSGAIKRNHPVDVLEKIWKDWEAFASYAFNKSHATCYAWVAYQTAYLKANYPAEYMASVLSNNMNDIKQVAFFMEECKRMGVVLLGPDINESNFTFAVNKKGEVRFGLGAIRGLGEGPVEEIVRNREENGNYESIFDMVRRLNLRLCNRRAIESLVSAGAFDSCNSAYRSQYFVEDSSGRSFIDNTLKYGKKYQQEQSSSQVSMFGDDSGASLPEPQFPDAEPWNSLVKLTKEKEVVGVFISGHPLDDFRYEIKAFCNSNVGMLSHPVNSRKELVVPAIITDCEERLTRKGDKFGVLIIEDYHDTFRLNLFGENYLRFQHFLSPGTFVSIKGSFQKSRYNDRLDFRISNIELLNELANQKVKNIHLKLQSSDLNQDYIKCLTKVLKQNSGDCDLKLTVYDEKEKLDVKFHSRSFSVRPSKDLFESLEKMEVVFTLN